MPGCRTRPLLRALALILVTTCITWPGAVRAQQCKAGYGCAGDEALMVQYREINGGSHVEFEISANAVPSSGYVGVGFNEVGLMPDASIVQCARTSPTDALVALSYANGRTPPVIYDYAAGLSSTSITYDENNGVLTCKFVRPKVPPSGAPSQFKDLSVNKADCIIMAKGAASGVRSIGFHSLYKELACNVDYSSTLAVTTPASGGAQATTCESAQHGCIGFAGAGGMSVHYREINGGQDVEFVVKGTPPGNGYVALGFNTEEEMAGAHIVECIRYNNNFQMVTAFAERETTPLQDIHNDGLTNTNIQSNHAELICKFTRSKSLPANVNSRFGDISKANCILMALGTASGAKTIVRHSTTREGGCGVDYAKTGSRVVQAEPIEPLVAVHGVLMLIGWLSFVPPGILVARFLKKAWTKEQQCCGKDVWFRTHQIMQSTGVILSVIAFIVIFVEEGGFVSGQIEVAHAICGIVTTVCGVAQPMMAFFRCAPGAENRVYFNWAHYLVGHIGIIMALVTVILASYMGEDIPGIAANVSRFRITLAIFIVVFALFYIILEILQRKEGSASKVESNGAGMQMAEGDSEQNEHYLKMQRIKQRVFSLFDVIKFILVVCLCVFIF